jgi:putative addiction module CopG family antidote
MTVTLTPEMEEIVKDQLATGQFTTQEEVVRAALLNMRRQYDELKAGIAEAIAQADRGELAPFDPAAILAEAKAARQQKQGRAP